MEQLYNIIVAKPNFPFEYLTYSSPEELAIGSVVQIEIKSTIIYGMVISKSNLQINQIKNLKAITTITSFVVPQIQIEFLKKNLIFDF